MQVIINSNLVSLEDAKISVSERGFRYGDGVFETIPVHFGKTYQFDLHLTRLKAGLDAIKIPFHGNALAQEVATLIQSNRLQDGFVRIYISRGQGGNGYQPDANAIPLSVIETIPYTFAYQPSCTLMVSSFEKISPKALPVQHKLAQGLQSTLVALEAKENACFDGLLLNAKQEICETSAANIFWLKNNSLYTPSLDCGVLEGSTRNALIRLSPYPVVEGHFTLHEIENAEAVILTNCRTTCQAVQAIIPCSKTWQSDELAKECYELIMSDIKNSG